MATRRVRTRIEVSSDRGVFMISVAAELADMHPQTLRMYESRGLIEPKRSPKGTRLYSHQDVERLRRIQEMTAELGMNLAGVERVFELEDKLDAMSRKVNAMEKRARELAAEVSGWRACAVSCAPRSSPTSAVASSSAAARCSASAGHPAQRPAAVSASSSRHIGAVTGGFAAGHMQRSRRGMRSPSPSNREQCVVKQRWGTGQAGVTALLVVALLALSGSVAMAAPRRTSLASGARPPAGTVARAAAERRRHRP